MAGARLTESLSAFAVAGELGRGQPAGHVARTCRLAMLLADRMGLEGEPRRDVFYTSLLVHAGCTAGVSDFAIFLLCDELALQRDMCLCDPGHEIEALRILFRHAGAGSGPHRRLVSLFRLAAGGEERMREVEAGCSDVGARIAARLGLPAGGIEALANICELWNGKGPRGRKGDEIPQPARVVNAAMTLELFLSGRGVEAAAEAARRRAGRSLDPAVCEAFVAAAPALEWDGSGGEEEWQQALALEPEPVLEAGPELIDGLAAACADFIDLKLPGGAAHSRRVATLAERIAARMGLDAVDVALARRAGYVHAIGAVSLAALSLQPGRRLSRAEEEQVRLHPALTGRILSGTPLARAAALGAMHHESLDGSGYPGGIAGAAFPVVARIVAAADAYDEAVMHSPPASPAEVMPALSGAAYRRFGGDVCAALAAEVEGRPGRASPPSWPAGLTDREVEVLRLAALGRTVREIGQQLSISPHTARHHIESVYSKAGVSSRAGATLFAMEHGLLG
jgi:HD-GYP domain-containing protein (c-di-GMP phosphodiesterase class II)/DNA-binding CsgD family transcriptional regulator